MRRILTCAALFVLSAHLVTVAGCGQPPPDASLSTQGGRATAASAAPSRAGSALASAPSPKHPAKATWADEIELVGFDAIELGPGKYEVAAYCKCLKRPAVDYAMGLHLVPANKSVLTPEAPLAVPALGALVWDTSPNPPTSAWEPGRSYRVAMDGAVPAGGGTWSIKVGFYQVAGGKAVQILPRTDAAAKRGDTTFESQQISFD